MIRWIRNLWLRLRGYTPVDALPIGVWVRADEQTYIMRHEDNSVTFQSTLTREHPTSRWEWHR